MRRTKTDKDQWKGGIIIRHDTEQSTLNPQQLAFVDAYVANGGNALQAAKSAGYADGGSNLLNNHKVREAIELKRDTEIKTAGATTAWKVMQDMMTDPAAPAQVRFQAARWTLEASGHGLSAVAAAIQLGKQGKKDQHEMSLSELADVVEKGRKQLDSMRQVVDDLKALDNAVDMKPDEGE